MEGRQTTWELDCRFYINEGCLLKINILKALDNELGT